jgi:hypothetical protein
MFSLTLEEALKYPWLSIHIHDPMMKGRSWNLQGMESIENSMDPTAKEKHEEEHENSKTEKNSEQPVMISRITRLPSWFEPIRSNQAEEIEVVMNNGV